MTSPLRKHSFYVLNLFHNHSLTALIDSIVQIHDNLNEYIVIFNTQNMLLILIDVRMMQIKGLRICILLYNTIVKEVNAIE